MTEEQLNENLIKFELQGICQDCIYLDKIVPIIRKMLSEEYKTGLEQSRFDKNMLERENQELKKQLNSDDWINSIKETERHYIYLIENENQELKKRLAESSIINVADHKYASECEDKVITMESQQKKFIEWLEQNIENEEYCYLAQNPSERCRRDVFEEVLLKYKETIGVKDE